jgi:hypothetical protein
MDNHSARSSLRDIFMLYIRKFLKSQRAEVLEIRSPEDSKSRSPKETKFRRAEDLKSRRDKVLKSRRAEVPKCRSTWHSSVMTCGTHSGSFGCVIRPFPRDTCHPSFHDTSTTVTSYDIRPPRHFDDFHSGEFQEQHFKLPKPELPK